MVIRAYPVPGKQKSIDLCAAFIEGAPKSAKGSVFYGVNQSNMREFIAAKATGEPWFYIDNSYFDKTRVGMYLKQSGCFRITKNAFQIRATKHTSDGERFAALGIVLQPWRADRSGYVLAIQQSPTFMTDIAGDLNWLANHIEIAVSHGGTVKLRRWSPAKPDIMKTLATDMTGASIVLTHSSAAAVEALIASVPVWVSQMSAVFGVEPEKRMGALGVLADNQFDLNEIRNGKAWQWLNR